MILETSPPDERQGRRSFFSQVAAIVVSLLAGIVPVATALVVFLNPLRRRVEGSQWIAITPLDALPADGRPYRFPVITDRWDAWNSYPPEAIGSIYLRRTSKTENPVALSSICPHLGCSVDFSTKKDEFICPCHNSMFTVDGARIDPATSPSPRNLDTLDVKIRPEDNQVMVHYLRFKSGTRKKHAE